MDNRFFQLPFHYDPARLQADLATCEAMQWKDHFNRQDYNGQWTGISLRSASGNAEDLSTGPKQSFVDTPLLESCPYFQVILNGLAFAKETVRLLALEPGSVILTHRDRGLGYPHGCFRLHIPIQTDEMVQFIVDDCLLHMEAGTCWYANFDLPHSVRHEGSQRRIHLVIDGIRNEWTDALFRDCGYDFDAEQQANQYDEKTRKAIIEQLRKMDTDTARRLIEEMEQGGK